ncbi:MAG: hypothetical protein IKO73_00900 [Bacteroidaceae bacterium]|nr:hypothetical protein [Bacteroidaceae bacterium]
MKTNKLICVLRFTVYSLLMALLFTSCYQPKVVMKTVIEGKGHSNFVNHNFREVTYSNVMSQEMRDSLWGKGYVEWSQPMPECLNTDAFCSTETKIGEGDTVTTTFWCPFETVEEMCEQTPLQLNGVRLRSKANLDKRFRWFYTEYTFTETFFCVGDTFKLPATDYADKAEISYWFTGQPNLLQGLNGAEAYEKLGKMEPAVTKWLNDNLFKVGFDFIVAHYDSIPNPPVSMERFIELQDSLVHFIMAGEEDILTAQPDDKLRTFFHSDAYAMFFDEDNTLGEKLNKEFQNRLNIFWFNVPYMLTMPGKVTDAGNGTLQPDGTIFYPFTGERLIPQDYTITATSRVTHIWAYIVTLLIIFLAIGSFLWRRRKE